MKLRFDGGRTHLGQAILSLLQRTAAVQNALPCTGLGAHLSALRVQAAILLWYLGPRVGFGRTTSGQIGILSH
jgi:hypothetical protein